MPQRTAMWSWRLLTSGLRERPDLVITTHVNFSPIAKILRQLRGIPYLAVGHGIEVWTLRNRSAGPGLRAANGLVAVSEFTRNRMAEVLKIEPGRIEILPNSFEESRFNLAPKPQFLLDRYGLRSDQPVVLSVGRLAQEDRYKGYDQILRALPEVRTEIPNVRYILGGAGPDRSRLEALIDELGIKASVTFAGYVSDDELCAHYNLCDLFAMPSKGEGFGIVFLEAMACGKPVLAGNKDGSVDALRNGELGVLVDPDNLQELSAAIVAVLAEVERRKAKGGSEKSEIRVSQSAIQIPEIVFQPEALHAKVIEHFGFERFKQRLGEILEPLLKAEW